MDASEIINAGKASKGVLIGCRLSAEERKQLKIRAAMEGKSIQVLLKERVRDLLQSNPVDRIKC